MKTIGMIGGMSWESSQIYYQRANQLIKEKLGGLHSAKAILLSVDFAEIAALQSTGQWDKAGEIMAQSAYSLQLAGADLIILCTNTMHKLAAEIEAKIQIPFLHIADATAAEIKKAGIKKVALLGTKFTMEHDFYRGRLTSQHQLEVITPREAVRNRVHEIIYQELCQGIIKESSRQEYMTIINQLTEQGAEGIILGCTEITMLIKQQDMDIPLFDTTELHIRFAIDAACTDIPPKF
ncbi:aspartate/glutamate racemase family protein [Iodobacter ciconiae]|uniref:Aspartate/glutamate racemase family protein n=1 Tax=Iodobacter ciconiae TaxID=2496266 RepID=A0A3S8ZWS4_9NEIS|nr:aspartate/glutamate racemase family protein [Iodobacter ciconiae]AZN37919.1 aspartate/glutamate racemase family protein [Iodobacter ciconiae]